jgi:hypothetical protein
VRLFLRAHDLQALLVLVPQERRLHDLLAPVEQLGLADDLGRDRVAHAGDRVQVLDLAARAERLLSHRAQRDVRVAAQAALLHVAVRDAEPAHQPAQRGQVGEGLVGRAQRGLGHHLGERHAAAVEVEAGLLAVAVLLGVRRLARVLLQVDARDRDRPRRLGRADVERAAGDDRRSYCEIW